MTLTRNALSAYTIICQAYIMLSALVHCDSYMLFHGTCMHVVCLTAAAASCDSAYQYCFKFCSSRTAHVHSFCSGFVNPTRSSAGGRSRLPFEDVLKPHGQEEEHCKTLQYKQDLITAKLDLVSETRRIFGIWDSGIRVRRSTVPNRTSRHPPERGFYKLPPAKKTHLCQTWQ